MRVSTGTFVDKILITSFAIFTQSCDNDCIDSGAFFYNEQTGKCENCKGESGYNVFDIEKIRRTKNAECLNLAGQNLVFLLDTAKIENFNESGYNILNGYNFRGASFDSSSLFFNDIKNADFSGADMKNFDFGYTTISGKIDRYTILPSTGKCNTKNDSLWCAL